MSARTPIQSVSENNQETPSLPSEDVRRAKESSETLSLGEQDKAIPELLTEIQHAEQKAIVEDEEAQEQEAAEDKKEQVARTRQDKKSKVDSQELLASMQEAKKQAKQQKQRQLAAIQLEDFTQPLAAVGLEQQPGFAVSNNTFANTCGKEMGQTSQATINAEFGLVSSEKTQTFVEGCNGEMSADKAARNKKEKSSPDKNGQANHLAKQGTAAQKNDLKTQHRVTSIYGSGAGMFELPPEDASKARGKFQASHVRSGKAAADTGEHSAQKHTPDDSPNNAPRAG